MSVCNCFERHCFCKILQKTSNKDKLAVVLPVEVHEEVVNFHFGAQCQSLQACLWQQTALHFKPEFSATLEANLLRTLHLPLPLLYKVDVW